MQEDCCFPFNIKGKPWVGNGTKVDNGVVIKVDGEEAKEVGRLTKVDGEEAKEVGRLTKVHGVPKGKEETREGGDLIKETKAVGVVTREDGIMGGDI